MDGVVEGRKIWVTPPPPNNSEKTVDNQIFNDKQKESDNLPSVILMTASSRFPSVSDRTVNKSSSFQSGKSSDKVDSDEEYFDFRRLDSSSKGWDGVVRRAGL